MDGRVQIQLSPGEASFEPRTYLRLIVEDAASGIEIVSVKLLADDVFALMRHSPVAGVYDEEASAFAGLEADLVDPAVYAAHVGTITKRITQPLGTRTEEAARRWLMSTGGLFDGAEHVRVNNRRGGWVVEAVYAFTAEQVANGEPETCRKVIGEAAARCAAEFA